MVEYCMPAMQTKFSFPNSSYNNGIIELLEFIRSIYSSHGILILFLSLQPATMQFEKIFSKLLDCSPDRDR